jgi:hypothetical protein
MQKQAYIAAFISPLKSLASEKKSHGNVLLLNIYKGVAIKQTRLNLF